MFTSNIGKPAGLITTLISLIVITPLCGFLFSCGCTWPGAGLEENCNYFVLATQHQCPWCWSFFAGGLSVGLAIFAGYFVSKSGKFSQYAQAPVLIQIFVRVTAGLSVFVLAAVVTGLVSAKVQGYPTFLFAL